VKMAVLQNGYALKHTSEKHNIDIVKIALSNNYGLILQYASTNLQDNREIVKLAVSQNGMNLKDASAKLRDDKEIVKIAISKNYEAYDYASISLKNNREILKIAVLSGYPLRFISWKFHKDKELLKIEQSR